jgi:phosphoribosylanthranilate isomerase
MVKVKICCISSTTEVQLAIAHGASAVGLVADMPSGPGVITNPQIAAIASQVPPPIATFMLTSRTTATQIIQHHHLTNTNTIQIVDTLTAGTYAEIKAALPAIKIVQVIHVINQQSVAQALAIAPQVHALLLDSGNPNQAVKELGGTGRVHNWALSTQIVQQSNVPVFLAGGLNANNVAQAIQQVQPFGVDVCSGVRTNGQLDASKLAQFFTAIKNA